MNYSAASRDELPPGDAPVTADPGFKFPPAEAVVTAGPCDQLPRPPGASQTGQGAETITIPVSSTPYWVDVWMSSGPIA